MRALARPVSSLFLLAFAGLLAGSSPASGHSGGLDAAGCHTNRKTGEYHCHRAAPAPTTSVPSGAVSPGEAVKKSRSGICHAPGTAYYAQTQQFTAFESIETCLASGGRLPKG